MLPYQNPNRFQMPFDLGVEPTFPGPYINVGAGSFPSMEQNDPSDILSMLGNFQPVTTMEDQFNQLIGQYPTRENPSKWRRLGAALVGAGYGPEGAQNFLDHNFNQQLADWSNKAKVLGQAADNERQSNNLNRQTAYQLGQQHIAQQKADTQQKAAETKAENDRRRTDIANLRAQVYQFNAMHPDWKVFANADGTVQAYNPQDPTQVINTPLMAPAKLSDEEKIQAGLEASLTRIAASGEQARETKAAPSGTRQIIQFTMPDGTAMAGTVDPVTNQFTPVEGIPKGATRATGTGAKPESSASVELGKKRALENRINRALIEHPEWRAWLQFDSNGEFRQITPVNQKNAFGISSGGPSQQTFNEIQQYLLGEEDKQAAPPAKKKPAGAEFLMSSHGPSTPKVGDKVGNARVRVKNKKTGQTGTIESWELENYPEWEVIR